MKKISQYIIASFLVIIVFFAFMEIATRSVSWFSGKGFFLSLGEMDGSDSKVESIYEWHPFTGFSLKSDSFIMGSHPNVDGESKIFVDQYGFISRDDGLKFDKPVGELRIATIGGSTTANVHLNYEDNWPGYLGNLLQGSFPNTKIRVINAGIPGFDTAQNVANLALRVMAFSPDIVIIYHGYNDLKAVRFDKPFKVDYSHSHDTPFGPHEKPSWIVGLLNHSMFYVRARNKYRDYKLLSQKVSDIARAGSRLDAVPAMAVETYKRNLLSLIAIAQAGGAKVVLSTFPTLHDLDREYTGKVVEGLSELKRVELSNLLHFTPGLSVQGVMSGLKAYNGIAREVAKEKGINVVDNAILVPHEEANFLDRVHVSQQGAKVIAENFFPVLEGMIRHDGK